MIKKNLILLSGFLLLSLLGLFRFQELPVEVTDVSKQESIQFESGLLHQGELLLTQPLTGFQFFSQSGDKNYSQQESDLLSLTQLIHSSFAVSREQHQQWIRLVGFFLFSKLFLKHGVLIQ